MCAQKVRRCFAVSEMYRLRRSKRGLLKHARTLFVYPLRPLAATLRPATKTEHTLYMIRRRHSHAPDAHTLVLGGGQCGHLGALDNWRRRG